MSEGKKKHKHNQPAALKNTDKRELDDLVVTGIFM